MYTILNADEIQNVTSEIPQCYSASDCIGDETQFCNHDRDLWGFCEKCSTVVRFCTDEEFLCERGQKSCNETCGGTNDVVSMLWI